MASSLRVPLPRPLVAGALVLSRTPVDDPEVVISRGAGRLASRRAEPLAQHIGDLRVVPLDDLDAAPVPPIPLLRGSGSSVRACERVSQAEYGWALLLRVRPADLVTADVAVRAAASVLAGDVHGVMLDTAIPRAYLPTEEGLAERASDLMTFDHEVRGSSGAVTTRGLARFGVPELTAVDVPVELLAACDALLVGVAHRVVAALSRLQDTEPAILDLRLPLHLTMADVAAGYGQPLGDDPTADRSSDITLAGSPGGGDLVVDSAVDAIRALFADALPTG